VSSVERSGRGLSLPAGRQGLILSGAFAPRPKGRGFGRELSRTVWRRRSIKVEGDEEKEVTIRHDNVPLKWKAWNDEDSSREWNKTYRIQKREKILT